MIIEIIKVITLAYVITTFAPLNWLLDLLPDNMVKYILVLLTSCLKCCSFWLGLSIGGIWIGVTSYIVATIWTNISSNITHLWIKYLNK